MCGKIVNQHHVERL
jgi:acyl-CoA reductase-like NAD-dependent aldehyde dehydrogenase